METHTAQHAAEDTTAAGLVKATLGAACVAAAIVLFIWLPAEYGVDPTGVGRLLGLTEMGDIKQQLDAEALADSEAALPQNRNADYVAILARLDSLQSQIDVLSTALPESIREQASTSLWRDEADYALEPGQGIEVKLVMNKGAVAEYAWTANGSVLNHDTHGDGNGEDISYKQGRAVPEDSGEITAAFTGYHGWFWRNRTEQTVTVTLQTRGEYDSITLP